MLIIPPVYFLKIPVGLSLTSFVLRPLRPAADARPHLVAAGLLGRVERQILRQQRPRPNQRHVALQHIDKLRQLVDRRGAHKPPHTRQPLSIRQQLPLRIPIVHHCLELDNLKDLLVLAGAFLQEEGPCAFVGKMQENGDKDEQPADEEQGNARYDEVEETFEEVFVHLSN